MKCCGQDMKAVLYSNTDDGWCDVTYKCLKCGNQKTIKTKLNE